MSSLVLIQFKLKAAAPGTRGGCFSHIPIMALSETSIYPHMKSRNPRLYYVNNRRGRESLPRDELTQEGIVYILYIYGMHLINSSEVNGIKIILSNASNDPIYIQIMNQIRQSILSGELRAGDSLPSIRQLAKDLQVSVITTKRAYEELENEKLIDSVVGKGCFVSGANKDFIREQRMKRLEEKMIHIIRESKELNMSQQDVIDHLTLLFEEEQTP